MKFSKKLFSLFVFLLAASHIVDSHAMKRVDEDYSTNVQEGQSGNSQTNILDLPPDILREIASYAIEEGGRRIINFKLVNKYFNRITRGANNRIKLKLTNKFLHSKNKFNSLILFIKNHPYLKIIEINASHTDITNQQLATLLNQGNIRKTLQSLNLGWCNQLQQLTLNTPALQTLNLSFCKQLDWDNIQLENPQNLIALNVCSTSITDKQLTTLLNQGNLRNTLQSLNLSGCNQLDWNAINLANLQNLTHLDVSYTKITDQQLATLLNQRNLRNTLQSLNLRQCNQLQQLTLNTPALQSLNLKWCDQLQQVTLPACLQNHGFVARYPNIEFVYQQ